MYKTINITQASHDKLKEYCKKNGLKITSCIEVLIDNINEFRDLGSIVDILQKLDIKDRLEVTKQMYESAKLSAKLEEVNKSLMESVA
jgi:hypothetical protein